MISHSAYLDNNLDFWEIRDLFTDNYALTGKSDVFDFCRLENWRYRIHSLKIREEPEYLSGLARLWRDANGQLIGLAISEDDDNDMFVFSRLGQESIEREIYKWIDDEWFKGRTQVKTFCDSDDTAKKKLLTEFGYALEGTDGHAYTYDLNRVRQDYELEAGYTVQDIRVDRNFLGRAESSFSAFNPDKTFDETRLFYWESTRGAPGYRPRLELAVVGPDGRIASGCLGWVDEKNQAGTVEPVSTHSAFQRRGFAKAMVTECFRRMKGMGIKSAIIGSKAEPAIGNRLYESLNPSEKSTDELWIKIKS